MADAMDEYDYEEGEGEGDELGYREVEIREQDRFLPIANIARIMKKVLPGNAKIAKDAKESIQECLSEFISFITSEASEKCQQERRKTINGDDILWAMSTLGFDKYVDPLKIYLFKYRDSVKGEKPEKKSLSNKKNSEAHAQPKKSMHSSHDPLNMSRMQYSRPTNSYLPNQTGGGNGHYSSYATASGLPSAGMGFHHSVPLVAPSKGEHVQLSLPPPPPMSLQPPPAQTLPLSALTPAPPSYLQQQQQQSHHLPSPALNTVPSPSLNASSPQLPMQLPPSISNNGNPLPLPTHVKLEPSTMPQSQPAVPTQPMQSQNASLSSSDSSAAIKSSPENQNKTLT